MCAFSIGCSVVTVIIIVVVGSGGGGGSLLLLFMIVRFLYGILLTVHFLSRFPPPGLSAFVSYSLCLAVYLSHGD